MERWVFQKMGKMGMMGKMGFKDGKDGFFERRERLAFLNPKMGKMGFYRCKDGKDGIKIPKRWERWVSNYKVLEKHQHTQKNFFHLQKNMCSREKLLRENPSFPSLEPIFPIFCKNPSFPSFKTKDGFWKDGSIEKNPSFPSFQNPSFPSYPSLKDGLPTPGSRICSLPEVAKASGLL